MSLTDTFLALALSTLVLSLSRRARRSCIDNWSIGVAIRIRDLHVARGSLSLFSRRRGRGWSRDLRLGARKTLDTL
jgi:hypothetical protein